MMPEAVVRLGRRLLEGASMGEILARAFRWGLAGLLIGPATVYSLMLVTMYRDPACATGGGGCQLDIAINMVLGVVFGFLLFFAISLLRGLLRRRQGS
jgi:hypothetical protein